MTTIEYQNLPGPATDTSWPLGLTPTWIEYLASRAIQPEIARQRGYDVLLSGRRKPNLDGRFATMHGLGPDGGLYIPLRGLLDPDGDACQLRIENPKPDLNGKVRKFRVPDGQRNVLATHPATIDRLGEQQQVIIIAEGITRVDALAGYGIPAVGLTGCDNWKGGKPSRVIPDFDALGIRGNRFLLAFDGDVASNRNVHRAAQGLADLLLGKGAGTVSTLALPDGWGLDDWLAREGFADANEVWTGLRQHSRAELGTRPPPRGKTGTASGGTGDVARYAWYAEGDFTTPWDCTPDADIMRTMRRHAGDLLVVIPDDGTRSYLRAASRGGVWARSDDDIDQLVAAVALEWAKNALEDTDVDRNTAAAVTRWQKRLAGTTGRNAAQGSVGRVRVEWNKNGMLPPALTTCKESEIDATRRYLGAPNGVIDLDTGELITGAAARALLVSRSVPDPYDPTAQHPVIDGLLAHLGVDERQYLLSALGFALRGNPARRFYLLAGERNGGKTTVLAAGKACVGDVKAGGYGMTIQPAVLLTDRLQHANGHQGGLFGVQDARIATVSEIPDGRGRFNVGLLKSLTGGDPDSVRDVGEKAGPSRPATATIFVAANPPDFDRLDLTDSALEDRARILPYPSLPTGQRNPAVLDIVQNNPKARQAMLAVLVRAAKVFAGNPYPPEDIPSVIEAVEDRRQASIGEVGQWLRDNLIVSGRRDHLLATDDLIAALAEEYPPDDKGRYAGQTRKNVLAMAREVVRGMPAAKVGSVAGKKGRYYRGVRLATQAELQAAWDAMLTDAGESETRCVRCEGDNDGRPLMPGDLCALCALAEPDDNLRRMPRVAPAVAVESLANTSLDEMAAVRALVSPMDAERAAVVLDVLTNRLEQVAQAVADGATMGSETPDQLVNRALPQWWGLVSELAAEGFDAKSEEESDGHRDG